jgi:hypothetical protein
MKFYLLQDIFGSLGSVVSVLTDFSSPGRRGNGG